MPMRHIVLLYFYLRVLNQPHGQVLVLYMERVQTPTDKKAALDEAKK